MKAKSLRKVLSLLMTLAMLLGMLSVTAFAEDTAPTNIAVYFCTGQTDYSVHEVSDLPAGASVLDAALAADSTFDINDSTGGVWMYTVNGELGTVGADDYILESYDFVAFYKVSDYKTTSIVSPTTYSTMIDSSYTSSGRWCGIYFENHPQAVTNGMLMNLDSSKSHKELIPVTATEVTGTTHQYANKYIVLSADSAAGETRLPSCIPMLAAYVNVYMPRITDMKTKALAFANAIPTAQLTSASSSALSSAISTLNGAKLDEALSAINSLMNTIAGLDFATDTRLNYMEFSDELTVAKAFFSYDYSYTSNGATVTVPYTVKSATGTPDDVPAVFTIAFTPMSSSATVTVTSADAGVTVSTVSSTSCKVMMNADVVAQTDPVTLTVTVTNGSYSSDYTLSVKPTREVTSPTASIYAFLPAPGQFTNEYVTQGGWGDAYNADGTLKMNNTTGMSLGFFGGYVVYQFDQDVLNSNSNPYGADFIVYGNAFWGNSEPGCIQVSQDGSTWYDIAGNRYYNSDTVKNFSLTYKNPDVTEDAKTTAAGSNLGSLAAVTYTGSASGTIATNTYHNHSWFPLNANYFSGRYGNAALDKVSALPFASRTIDSGVTGTLTLSGVKLSNVSTSDTAGYGFGYCDVHPNNELGGTVAYNPYQTFSSSSDYSTKTAGTSGGDPIDISWAVDGDGNPVNLSYIRYVRIYTGAAQMNGIFGEISTESLGVAACTGAGTGLRTAAPTVTVDGITVIPGTTSASIPTITYEPDASITIEASASENHIYVNDVSGVGNATKTIALGEEELIVRVIAQDTTTGNPYIGYIRLVGEY